jgi:nitrate/nitrite transporter NarK
MGTTRFSGNPLNNPVDMHPAPAVPKHAAATTVSLVILCNCFNALAFGGIALFLPLIREDLHISFTQAGMLSVAATATYALGQIPAGFLTDRFGPKRLFFIGVIGSTAFMLQFGMVASYGHAVVNQLLAGVFRSFLFAPGLTLLSSWFPPERRATAMGVYVAGNFTGNIILSLVGPLMVASHNWRFPFIVFSVAGMGVAALFLVFAKEKVRRASRDPIRFREVLQLARYRIVWLASALQIIRMGPVVGISFWLPSFLVADRGLTLQTAGLVTALGAALSAPSNALGGYVSDRLNNPPLVIGGALTILATTAFLLVQVQSLPLLLLVIAFNSIFAQFYFGPLFLVPVEVLGQRTAGIVTGFCNLFANLGSVGFAYALGVIRDRTGSFAWGFGVIGMSCLTGVALSFLLARMRRRALAAKTSAA